MASTKPAIVVIPGAWHVPIHYHKLDTGLKKAGYEVTVVRNPSAGPPKAFKDQSHDIAAAQEAMKAYIDRGLNVVLVMHSIGGAIGCSAARGFRPEEQPNGKGIISLVYIAAFAVPEGKSVMGLRPKPEHASWIRVEGEMGSGCFMICGANGHDVEDIFYNDCTPEDRKMAKDNLEWNFCESVCWDPSSCGPYTMIESNYLICEIDNVFPVPVQEAMASQPGKWKRVERIHSGHSPFISRPEETVAFVRRSAGEEL